MSNYISPEQLISNSNSNPIHDDDEDVTDEEPLVPSRHRHRVVEETPSVVDDQNISDEEEEEEIEPVQLTRKHKTHYRSFRKGTPEELLLLKALSAHCPFTAKFKEKQATWDKVVNWLHAHDEARSSRTPPDGPLFSGIQSRTCRLAWSKISKEYADYQRKLKSATGVEIVEGERIQLIENLYRTEQNAINTAATEKETRSKKQDDLLERRRQGEELRDRAESMEPRRRQRSDSVSSTVSSAQSSKRYRAEDFEKDSEQLQRDWEEQMEFQREQKALFEEQRAVLAEIKKQLSDQTEANQQQFQAKERADERRHSEFLEMMRMFCQKP